MALIQNVTEGLSSLVLPLDDLCTPPMVATLLGVSPPTVYAALRRTEGGLTHLRTPGGQIRVKRRDVLAFCHREGYAVPQGLVPSRPQLVLLHPSVEKAHRLRSWLSPLCRLEIYPRALDGLLAIGLARPLAVLVSDELGDELIGRLRRALVDEEAEVGYLPMLVLDREAQSFWQSGPVPQPLRLPEPGPDQSELFAETIRRLLGIDSPDE